MRRSVAREEPGVREQRREQEQPPNTKQQAVAREEEGEVNADEQEGMYYDFA